MAATIKNSALVNLEEKEFDTNTKNKVNAPSDGNLYAKKNNAWTEVVEEAPKDSKIYGRTYKNGKYQWVEVS